MNSVYFLTYNIDTGDGKDIWMWTSPDVRDRFDVSKLDQWEIVFSHMDRLGLMMHVILHETENDRKLGGSGGLNPIRRLYLREIVSRFAHHPAIVWNLGEENILSTRTARRSPPTFARSIPTSTRSPSTRTSTEPPRITPASWAIRASKLRRSKAT